MSDQENKGSSGISPQGIFVVVAIIASLVVGTQIAFQSKRPPDPGLSGFTSTDVRARLWEDPFAAVENHLEKEKALKITTKPLVAPLERTANEILEKFEVGPLVDKDANDLTTLVVMVSGGPYSEDAENRLRTRHAIVSGLDILGYVPASGRFISYMDFRSAENQSGGMSGILPFEWFKARHDETNKVMVMWLDDTEFLKQDKPLSAINDFIQRGRQTLGFVKLAREVSRKMPGDGFDAGKALKSVLVSEKLLEVFCKRRETSKAEKKSVGKTEDNKEENKRFSDILQHIYTKSLKEKCFINEVLLSKKFAIPQDANGAAAAMCEDIAGYCNGHTKGNSVLPILDKLDCSLQPFTLKQFETSLRSLLATQNSSSSNTAVNTDSFSIAIEYASRAAKVEKEGPSLQYGQALLKTLFKTALGKSIKNRAKIENDSKQDILAYYLIGDAAYTLFEDILAGKLKDEIDPERKKHYEIIKNLTGEWVLESLNVPRLKVRVIGPTSSGTLKKMVKEKPEFEREEITLFFTDMQVFSPRATVSINNVLPEKRKTKNAKDIYESGKTHNPYFLRTVATDDITIKALIEELKKRGIDASSDTIYLVSEWDTLYGRELPRAFCDAAQHNSGNCNILKFSYLRGIDGSLANKAKRNGDREKDAKEGAFGKKDQELEKATGDNQYDYIRRLANYMQALKPKSDSGDVKAIGVLGSDAYDKLLVLQALRPLFPNVVFFTTDLDAVLLQRDHYQWTHNLIISSSFGLRLHKTLQKEIPPFRDSYQTATFFSTLLALGMRNNETAMLKQESLNKLLKPRIFEIGRSGAFDLSGRATDAAGIDPCLTGTEKKDAATSGSDNAGKGSVKPFFEIKSSLLLAEDSCPVRLHPQREDFCARFNWKDCSTYTGPFGFFVLMLAFFFLFLLYFCWLKRNRQKRTKLLRHFWSASLAALIVFIVIIGFVGGQNCCGEPWALLEGISIWPTEIMRILCGMLAVYFCCISMKKMNLNDEKIGEEYFKEPFEKHIRKDHPEYVYTYRVWQKYKELRTGWSQYVRVFLLTIFYLLICYIFITLSGRPLVPLRTVPVFFDIVLNVFLLVLPMLFLVFLVLDTTLLSIQLFRRLSKNIAIWPDTILEDYQAKLGLHVTRFPKQRCTEDVECLAEWITIRVIAKHSEVVGKFIYYPFIVICLMVLARNSYFDYWYTPPALIIVIALAAGIVALSMILLQRQAKKARGYVLTRYSAHLIKAAKQDQGRAEQVKLMIAEIGSLRQGAFASFFEQPLVRSLLLLLSSGGGLWLLNSIKW